MSITVAEIARELGCAVEGDGSIEVRGIAGLREAGPGDISFLANPRYANEAEVTRASAVIVPLDWSRPCAAPALLRVREPDRAFARVAERFSPPPVRPAPGIHPTAVIAPDARLGSDVSIGPHCVVDAGVSIGDRTILYPGCWIGNGAEVGADCLLHARVSVRERCRIGNRVILHCGVVVGSDGFGYTQDENGARQKIPQMGIVIIGDDVEIGANTTIDRARFGQTSIGNGVKIDNLVQIAHNVRIGDHAVLVAQSGVAGSTELGPRAILAAQAGVAGHLVVGENAVIGAQAGIMKDVPSGAFVLGAPGIPHVTFMRLQVLFARLPELFTQVRDLLRWRKSMDEKAF